MLCTTVPIPRCDHAHVLHTPTAQQREAVKLAQATEKSARAQLKEIQKKMEVSIGHVQQQIVHSEGDFLSASFL